MAKSVSDYQENLILKGGLILADKLALKSHYSVIDFKKKSQN